MGQHFIGAFPVDSLLILAVKGACFNKRFAKRGINRTERGLGRQDFSPGYHAGRALCIQEGYKRLSCFQFHDGCLGIKGRVGPEGLRCRLHRFLIQGCKCPERVLHPVAQLAQNGHGYIGGVLGDKIYADALASDEAYRKLYLLHQKPRTVGKQQMRLIKEVDHPGFFAVPLLGQTFIQLAEQSTKGRWHTWRASKTICPPPEC